MPVNQLPAWFYCFSEFRCFVVFDGRSTVTVLVHPIFDNLLLEFDPATDTLTPTFLKGRVTGCRISYFPDV